MSFSPPRPRQPAAAPGRGAELPFRLRVSITRADPPVPGLRAEPLQWGDVLNGAPPTCPYANARRYVAKGPEVTEGTLRIGFDLLVGFLEDPEGGPFVDIEDRVSVSERALAGAIAAEHATIGPLVARARRRGDRVIRGHRLHADRLAKRGGPTTALGNLLQGLVDLEHRVWNATLTGFRKTTKSLAAFPDALGARGRLTRALLATPEGRKRLRFGLTRPQDLTTHEKAVVLFLGTLGLLSSLVLVHLAVTLAFPALATPWRTAFLLFLYAYIQSLGLPLPIEPLILLSGHTIGIVPTVVTAVTAKVTAGYMAFFLGDEIHDRLRARKEGHPLFTRMLAWSERFAARFGLIAMAVFIAIPGFPDAVALYLFGALGMPLRRYLLGIAIGAATLYTTVLVGFHALL